MRPLALPEGVPPGLEVWRLPLALDAAPAEADWHLLSDDERARALRWRRQADRVRAVATRAALRRLLGARLGRAPTSLRFTLGPQGKPGLADHPIAFNVSHSGAQALLALAGAAAVEAIGVDVERVDATVDVASLARLAATPRECEAIGASPACFYGHWVGKEAALKALGLGVAGDLRRVDIEPLADARLRVTQDLVQGSALRACLLPVPEGYAGALAWQTMESR